MTNLAFHLRRPTEELIDHGASALQRLPGWNAIPIACLQEVLRPGDRPFAALVCEWMPEHEGVLPRVCARLPTVLLAASPGPTQAQQALALGACALLNIGADPACWMPSLPLWIAQHAQQGRRRSAPAREQEPRGQALQESRTISAAVGMLAERDRLTIDQAFAQLRDQARSSRRRLEQTAAEVLAAHRSRLIGAAPTAEPLQAKA